MGRGNKQDQALRLTWRYACLEENINPRRPTRPPLLFAIDQKLKIAGGARYTLKRSERDEADVGDENFACSGGLISDSSGAGEGFSGMGGDFGGAGAQGGSCGGDSGGGSSCSGGGGCGGE